MRALLVPVVLLAVLVAPGAAAEPELTVTAPAPGGYVNAADPDPYPLAVTASEDVASVEFFRCDDTSVDCSTGAWVSLGSDSVAPFTADWAVDADGNRALRAVGTDTADPPGTGQAVVNVTIDRTPPTTPLTAPAAGAFVAGAVAVSANAGDAGSGVESVVFERSPAGEDSWAAIDDPDSSAPYSASWATDALADGGYELRARARDNAGNTRISAARTVTVDNTPPSDGSVVYPHGYDADGAVTVVTDDGVDTGSGIDTSSGVLERQVAPLADDACGSYGDWNSTTASNMLASGRCAQYRYTIADNAGNTSTYVSPNVVKVDTSDPSPPVLTLGETDPDEHVRNATLFYNPAGDGGSFTVEAEASDPESGIAHVSFPAVFGADGSNDDSSPYARVYSWAGGETATGAKTVTATNRAGGSASEDFRVSPDIAGPQGGEVSYANDYDTDGTLNVDTVNGSDAGSGIDPSSSRLERRTTTLAGGACGTFAGAWTGASSPDTVDSGTCAQYRYGIGDNVGNETVYTSNAIAKVDMSPPEVANLPPLLVTGENKQYFDPATDTLYFRPAGKGSFRLRATVSDAESADGSVIFPTFNALSGWTAIGGPDDTGPYVSTDYEWDNGAASPGPRPVRGRNNAGLEASTQVTITADAAAPTGGSVSYPHGYDADGIVTVTTDAGTDALSGLGPEAGTLERALVDLTGGACAPPATWTTVTSPDTVPSGKCARYRYRVSDRVGNQEVYTSANVVKVDTAAPSALALTLDDKGSPHGAVSGSQIFVNTAQSGDFEVKATVSDPDSGIAKVSFPERPEDDAAPFEATYAFTDLTGPQTVTASDGAGNSATASFTVTPDTQAPTGGSITYEDGYDTDGTITVSVSNGSDTGAGLAPNSATLERQTAPLTDGNCGLYGPWAETTATNTVATGRCARYRYLISDRVGNQAVHESTDVVKVDAESPTKPALTFETSEYAAVTDNQIYVNTSQTGSFGVAATTSDTASGIAKVRFPLLREDTEAPYEETYGFGELTGVRAVVAFDRAGRTASSSFEVIPDTESPLGVSVDYAAGYDTDGRVQLTTANGADPLAGIDGSSGVLERDVAPLDGKTCGAFTGAWEAAENPDILAPNTCARYRYRIFDRVGNEAVFESGKVVKFDTTAPGDVTGATATAKDHLVQLRWTRPGDTDFAGVRVFRRRGDGPAVEVSDGACPTIFCDNTVTNGVTYTYELVTRDLAGNESAGVELPPATPRSLYLLSPKDGAVVTRPPLLDWRDKARATYYNLQLLRNGVKILSVHPTASQFRLRSSWTYAGRRFRLSEARYRWQMFPGFGKPSAARFGNLLGWSEFTKRS